MKRYIICAILVLAVATQAYGFGHHGGNDGPPGAASGSTSFAGSAPAGVSVQPLNSNGANNGNSVAVPEPTTLLLLGAGLVGLYGLRRKMK